MPATNPTTIKLTPAERARLADLGQRLAIAGRPLSMADVIRVAVEKLDDQTRPPHSKGAKKNPR
jgi:hypothetical protein